MQVIYFLLKKVQNIDQKALLVRFFQKILEIFTRLV